jgi:hypothetical protein
MGEALGILGKIRDIVVSGIDAPFQHKDELAMLSCIFELTS